MKEDPEHLTVINPSIPPALNTIVGKALAKEPAGRYRTCSELIEDLRNFETLGAAEAGGAGVAARPGGSGGKRASSDALAKTIVAGAAPGADRQKPAQPLREQWKALTMAGAGLALLLIVGMAYFQTGTGSKPGAGGESEIVAPAPGEQLPEATPATPPPAGQPAASAVSRPQAQQPPPSAATPPPVRTATPPAAPARPAAGASSASSTAAAGVGRVSVHTEPQGARIFVDDKETSYRTPVNFGLAAGRHQIRVERQGYDSQTKEIVVRPNETVTEQFRLQSNGEGRNLNPFR